MESLQIELKRGAESFRALYYKGEQKTLFASRKTKWLLGQTGIFGLATFLFYVLSFSNNVPIVMLWLICAAVFVVSLLLLIDNMNKYLKWKKSVDVYVKALAKYDTQMLRLTEHAIELENSDEISMVAWDAFKRAVINKTHISLSGEKTQSWVLPAASMEAHEYESLKEFIRRRMHEAKAIKDAEGPAPGADPSDGNLTKC